jgi:hypothetical protein
MHLGAHGVGHGAQLTSIVGHAQFIFTHGVEHGVEHGVAHGFGQGAAHGLAHGVAHGFTHFEHGVAHGLLHGLHGVDSAATATETNARAIATAITARPNFLMTSSYYYCC